MCKPNLKEKYELKINPLEPKDRLNSTHSSITKPVFIDAVVKEALKILFDELEVRLRSELNRMKMSTGDSTASIGGSLKAVNPTVVHAATKEVLKILFVEFETKLLSQLNGTPMSSSCISTIIMDNLKAAKPPVLGKVTTEALIKLVDKLEKTKFFLQLITVIYLYATSSNDVKGAQQEILKKLFEVEVIAFFLNFGISITDPKNNLAEDHHSKTVMSFDDAIPFGSKPLIECTYTSTLTYAPTPLKNLRTLGFGSHEIEALRKKGFKFVPVINERTYLERILSSEIDKEECVQLIPKYIKDKEINKSLITAQDVAISCMNHWAKKLEASVQNAIDYYYHLLKNQQPCHEKLNELTKEEAELLKMMDDFDVEGLNLYKNLSASEKELLELIDDKLEPMPKKEDFKPDLSKPTIFLPCFEHKGPKGDEKVQSEIQNSAKVSTKTDGQMVTPNRNIAGYRSTVDGSIPKLTAAPITPMLQAASSRIIAASASPAMVAVIPASAIQVENGNVISNATNGKQSCHNSC